MNVAAVAYGAALRIPAKAGIIRASCVTAVHVRIGDAIETILRA